MISLQADSLRDAARHLFAADTFDAFHVLSVNIQSFITFQMDGHTNADFYRQQDTDANGDAAPVSVPPFIKWAKLRPVCYEIIKGKIMPVSFRINLLTGSGNDAVIPVPLSAGSPSLVSSYSLQIQYRDRKLFFITGLVPSPLSPETFTRTAMDEQRSMGMAFDKAMPVWLEKNGLSVTAAR